MNVYVYQRPDREYGVGYVKRVCEKRGRIVERWPVDTEEQRLFLERHGSNYGNITDEVRELAYNARFASKIEKIQQESEESVLVNLAGLPIWERIKTGLRLVFGRF